MGLESSNPYNAAIINSKHSFSRSSDTDSRQARPLTSSSTLPHASRRPTQSSSRTLANLAYSSVVSETPRRQLDGIVDGVEADPMNLGYPGQNWPSRTASRPDKGKQRATSDDDDDDDVRIVPTAIDTNPGLNSRKRKSEDLESTSEAKKYPMKNFLLKPKKVNQMKPVS